MANPHYVITYHAVDERDSVLSSASALLRSQWESWRANGFRFLRMAEFEAWMAGGDPPGQPSVLLTFDDGLRCVYEHAFPLMKELEIPATVFLVTGHMGGKNDWSGQADWVAPMDVMSWDEACEMASAGVEFGCHTASHADLRNLSDGEIEAEFQTSKAEIERRLGGSVAALAYPFGRYSPGAVEIARRHFSVGFTTTMSEVRPGCDALQVPRIDAYYLKPAWVHTRLHLPLIGHYLRARQWMRNARGS